MNPNRVYSNSYKWKYVEKLLQKIINTITKIAEIILQAGKEITVGDATRYNGNFTKQNLIEL
jgi:hypothetical protein